MPTFLVKNRKNSPPAALLSQNTYFLYWTGIVQKSKNREKILDNIGSCPDNSHPAYVITTRAEYQHGWYSARVESFFVKVFRR